MNEPNEEDIVFTQSDGDDQDSLSQSELNVYHAAYEYVSSLVTEDGDIRPVFPFVPGMIDTDAAFSVLMEKIFDIFSESPEDSFANAHHTVCMAFMMGAWVGSLQSAPVGYNITLTQEQISQVVHAFIDNSLGGQV